MPGIRPRERFTFMRWCFDVSACETAIAEGKVAFEDVAWNRDMIVGYAERLLGLSPDRVDGISGLMAVVEVAYARALGPTATADPILLVENQPGIGQLHVGGKSFFLVNGNHRIAKAYFEEADSLRVRVVARKDANPFLL